MRAAVASGASSTPDSEAPLLASFYFRYPDPLGFEASVPHLLFQNETVTADYSKAVLHGAAYGAPEFRLPDLEGAETQLFTSIRFFRRPVEWEPIASLSELTTFLSDFIPGRRLRTPRDSVDERSYTTWVEITTPLAAPAGGSTWSAVYELGNDEDAGNSSSGGGGEDTDDSLGSLDDPASGPNRAGMDFVGLALDRAFEALDSLIRSYRVARHLVIPTFSLPRAPFNIFTTFRRALSGYDAIVDFTVITNVSSGEFYRSVNTPPVMEPEDLTELEKRALIQFLHPGVQVGELQVDAGNAINVYGELRGGVLLAHTASEVLLDLTLAVMLYEEQVSPQDGARLFLRRRTLASRVKSDYSSRLGGQWDPSNGSVCGKWHRDLLQLRNRVAHGAYLPTFDEAKTALDRHHEFATYVRDRIAANFRKYPFTMAVMVSEDGMRRRRGITTEIRKMLERSNAEELGTFAEWYSAVTSYREQPETLPAS